MAPRTTVVDELEIKAVIFSSVLQIGDSQRIQSSARALAVQRQAEIFFGNEGDLAPYGIFSEPIPLPSITEQVQMYQHNINPCIKVGKIDILGVSTAAVVHLGNTCHVTMEARIKHIRQLLPDDEQQ
ncbi:spore germination protein GerPE [Bacillus sp. FJAT-27251]|uniref:spore germination protein GerPE n=1 Tax=Bacillus sp. FJAT-27251 TaxID=1684142 RepID=UPI0006A7A748|nr:spore germination protein GerPE [Bacillus sp. FJAT-27251]